MEFFWLDTANCCSGYTQGVADSYPGQLHPDPPPCLELSGDFTSYIDYYSIERKNGQFKCSPFVKGKPQLRGVGGGGKGLAT